jgi:hypothetical protein
MKILIWSKWKGLNSTIVLKDFEQINGGVYFYSNAGRLLLTVTRGVYCNEQK